MKKSEGFYLIRDNRLRRLERQTLETLIKFVKFVFMYEALGDEGLKSGG